MPLDKQGYILRHECCQMTGVQFLPLEMPTFTQAMKLKLGRKQFDKRNSLQCTDQNMFMEKYT